jgi:O-antigen ligase
VNLNFLYFFIPPIIFCTYSSTIQFGSTIKLVFISILIFIALFASSVNTKQFQKLPVVLLFSIIIFPILLSLAVTGSFQYINLLQYSNLLFLIFIFITFQVGHLRIMLYSFAISLLFLLPLALILKDEQTYGDPVGNANILGQMIGVGLISIFYLIIRQKLNMTFIYISALPIIGSMYLLLQIKSRGSFLFIIFAVITMLILQVIKKKYFDISKKMWLMTIAVFVFLTVFCVIIIANLDWNLYLNLAYRKNLWEAGLKIFCDHWFLGIGDGNLAHVLPNYWDKSTNVLSGAGETEYHIHNEFLNIGIQEGIISLFLFGFLICLAFINGLKFYFFSKHKDSNFILPFLAIFLGVCFQISVDRILHFTATGLLFALICGLLLTLTVNIHSKPIKISKYLILSLALLYSFFTLPFIYQQYLYVKNNTIPELSIKKFENLKSKISKDADDKDVKSIIHENIMEYPESSLKKIIENKIDKNIPLSKTQYNSIFLMLIDLELGWSRNYETIISHTNFPDLKVMAYKKFVGLLIDEGRKEEALSLCLKANAEYPLIMKFTYIIYVNYCEAKEYQKGLDYLLKASKISSDPYLIKKIIFHYLIFEKKLDFDRMKECIQIRQEIEYNPQYAKKNLAKRFGTLDSYYIGFIYELLSIKEFDKGYEILLQYVKDEKLRIKPSFKEFIHNIKVAYPDIYAKLKQEPFLNL